MLSTPPAIVQPAPTHNRLGEPISPFVLSLLKLQQEQRAAADREFTAAEMREFNAFLDEQDAVACELAARADEAAEELSGEALHNFCQLVTPSDFDAPLDYADVPASAFA